MFIFIYIKKLKSIWWRRIFSPIYSIFLKACGVNVGKEVIFWGIPIIEFKKKSQISIGDNVVVCSKSEFTALGVRQPVIIRALTDESKIVISNNVGISGATICSAVAIHVAEDVLIGADAMIVDTDFHPVEKENRRFAKLESAKSSAVLIKRNVFIGARAIVLKGACIGENAVVGAGSLVCSEVPNECVVVGVPAKTIRFR